MIDVNKLRGRMAEKGRTGQDMAKVIGKTPKTFYAKMKAGVFDSDEIEAMVRERKNLTLDEVAKRCKTTKQTIFKYESEIVTNIPYDKIVLLTKALNVSPSYLFGWEEKESSPSESTLTEGEQMILNIFRQIPEDQQRVFLEMGRVYANSLKRD